MHKIATPAVEARCKCFFFRRCVVFCSAEWQSEIVSNCMQNNFYTCGNDTTNRRKSKHHLEVSLVFIHKIINKMRFKAEVGWCDGAMYVIHPNPTVEATSALTLFDSFTKHFVQSKGAKWKRDMMIWEVCLWCGGGLGPIDYFSISSWPFVGVRRTSSISW